MFITYSIFAAEIDRAVAAGWTPGNIHEKIIEPAELTEVQKAQLWQYAWRASASHSPLAAEVGADCAKPWV